MTVARVELAGQHFSIDGRRDTLQVTQHN